MRICNFLQFEPTPPLCPDLAKFHQFGNILETLEIFKGLINIESTLAICHAIGQI